VKKSSFASISLMIVLSLSCAVYRPKSPIPSGYSKQVLADVTSKTLLQDYNKMPQTNDTEKAAKVARRNQILTELIYLVDQNYYSFENHFYGSQATFSTGADAANLGLTAAGAVTGTAALKSILSATATGVTGFKTSVEKNFFDQQSRAAVVTKMRALRATQLATLGDTGHMKAGVTEYSLEAGISDVGVYYDAGTVVAALQSIAQTAGKEADNAQQQQKQNGTKSQAIQ
jgi:hypothetical protein